MRSKDVAPHVEKIMQEGQEYRDSDKKLLIRYWELYNGFYMTEAQKIAFMNLTPAESITRAARDLRPFYPATPKVTEQRYDNFKREVMDHGQDVTSIILKGKGTNLRTMLVDGEWITVLDD
jgi:hypothetical protein